MLTRRQAMSGTVGALSGAALLDPLNQWLVPAADEIRATPSAGGGRLGVADVEALEHSAAVFRSWDNERGGGLCREAVVGQLAGVVRLLRDRPCHGAVERRLLAVAADLAALAGWMTYDSGLHRQAQQFFVAGLRAAHAAGDAPLGAEILTRMARQQIHLGHPQEALALVRLARRGGEHAATATVRAMLAIEQARIHARLGERSATECLIDTATEQLADADFASDPVWSSYFDAAELAGVTAICWRDLARNDAARPQASDHFQRALQLRRPEFARCEALDLAGLAAAHLAEGDPEQACAAAHRALDAEEALRSRLVVGRLHTLRRHVTAFAGDTPAVQTFSDRLDHRLVRV